MLKLLYSVYQAFFAGVVVLIIAAVIMALPIAALFIAVIIAALAIYWGAREYFTDNPED